MTRTGGRTSRRGEKGFALLAALWLVSVASLIATGALAGMRIQRRQAMNAVSGLEARQVARAGVEHALSRLRSAADSARLEEAPVPLFWNGLDRFERGLDSVAFPGGSWYRVKVTDAGQRLPLNDAAPAELVRLFMALDVPLERAEGLAASIADWRDPDDLHRAGGAEWTDYYRQLPLPVVPRNGAFLSIDELVSVRGMTAALFRRCSPLLTLDRGSRVNLNSAPAPVLRALPGLNDEVVRVLIERRRERRYFANFSDLEAALSPPARAELQRSAASLISRVSFEPQQVLVDAEGHDAQGAVVRVVAVVSLAGGSVQVASSLYR